MRHKNEECEQSEMLVPKWPRRVMRAADFIMSYMIPVALILVVLLVLVGARWE